MDGAASAQPGNSPKPQPARQPDPPDPVVRLVNIDGAPVRGKNDALVTIVEFADFECPFCQRAEVTMRALQAKYGDKIRVVWRNVPLPIHDHAEPSAELASIIFKRKGNDAFWTAHDALLDPDGSLDDASLGRIADHAALDANTTMKDVTARSMRDAVEFDEDAADDLGVASTPQFFVNGHRIKGAQPKEVFELAIDREIASAEAMVAAGTAPSDVYAAIMKTAKAPDPLVTKTPPKLTKANPVRGPSNATVTIQVFTDYQCPFCKKLEPTLARVALDYPTKVRVAFHDLPLPMHKDALPAAKAAREARRQGGDKTFWAFHDALYETLGSSDDALKQPGLDALAKKLGLDMTAFDKAIADDASSKEIEDDKQLALTLDFHGTPSALVGDFVVVGSQPAMHFEHLVRLTLKGKH